MIHLSLLPLLIACQKGDPELARRTVEAGFAEQNPSGRAGLELVGKSVWLEAPMFGDRCVEEKGLAFNDDPRDRPSGSVHRISPTYKAQRFLTAGTDRGYCVLLGSDPKLQMGEPTWVDGEWRISVKLGMGSPSPWFECIDPEKLERTVVVKVDDEGKATMEGDVGLWRGACPSPLPGGEERGSGARPSARPPSPPTADDVRSLASRFDTALYDGDLQAALGMTICYNLYEENKVGSCSVGELVSVGPSFKGDPRPRDGTPWLEYLASDESALPTPVRDGKDASLFHVVLKNNRTGRDRSFSVQWTGDQWKLVGVIGRKAETITSIRYIYDLHKGDRRDIFEKRMKGEKIDEDGNPAEDNTN